MRNYRVIMSIIAGFIYEIDNPTFSHVEKKNLSRLPGKLQRSLCIFHVLLSYRPYLYTKVRTPEKNKQTLTEIKKEIDATTCFFQIFLKSFSFWCGVNLIFRKRHPVCV